MAERLGFKLVDSEAGPPTYKISTYGLLYSSKVSVCLLMASLRLQSDYPPLGMAVGSFFGSSKGKGLSGCCRSGIKSFEAPPG
jgi:hypothetical protein